MRRDRRGRVGEGAGGGGPFNSFHRLQIWLSVRPGSIAAIADQLAPVLAQRN
jgi:hypothetical protein